MMSMDSSLAASISRISVHAPVVSTSGVVRRAAIRCVFNRNEDILGINAKKQIHPVRRSWRGLDGNVEVVTQGPSRCWSSLLKLLYVSVVQLLAAIAERPSGQRVALPIQDSPGVP
jgi:hypothetical protein